MKKIISTICLATLLLFFSATLSGTFLYLIYPKIHILFPNAYQNGIITHYIGWWDCVCITWIFNILIKSTTTIKN